MGRGRGKPALAITLGAIAFGLPLAGCGAEDHPNDPRPPTAIEVSVNISDKALTVSPSRIAYAGSGGQNISQNENEPEPTLRDGPQTVNFTVSNTTGFDTELEVEGAGARGTESGPPIVANGVGTFKVALETGDYLLSAADIPAATAARFSVGPDRVSSQNDLLLP